LRKFHLERQKLKKLFRRVAKTDYCIGDILHWLVWISVLAACFNPRDFPKQVGYIIVASMALILLPIYRLNIWTKITGVAFPDAVKYHRWLGRIIFLLCMIHMFGYWKQWSDQGVFPSEMFIKPKNTWGHIAAIFIIVLTASSIFIIRRKLWDLFKIIHILTFLGFFVAGLIHQYVSTNPRRKISCRDLTFCI
jgi:predicted ferric reductase